MNSKGIKCITVLGRKWHDKVNGNTYHSARVFADGKLVAVVPFQYGYGDKYVWNAIEALDKAGVFKGEKARKEGEAAWSWIRNRLGIGYVYYCAECTKRECIEFGDSEAILH